MIWHIDHPVYRVAADSFQLRGWIASDVEVQSVRPKAGDFLSFAWIDRTDLVPPPGGMKWARGFEARARTAELEDKTLFCEAEHATGRVALTWDFQEAIDVLRKERKLDSLEGLFRDARQMKRRRYFYVAEGSSCTDAEPALVSGYHYPQPVVDVINRYEAGWILDCGAGCRPVYYDNVVNLEIAPYPSTDVLADAEALPFRDHCFDAVVTLATLEHVRRPWKAAAEIVRVLKPGGLIFADVPFLQPVHAYPSHFFNMTSEGLRSLFEDQCEVLSVDVPQYGRPIFTLSWFLNRYAAGLSPVARADFVSMTVKELMCPSEQQVGQPYVTVLPKPFEFELASVTTVVARKKGP